MRHLIALCTALALTAPAVAREPSRSRPEGGNTTRSAFASCPAGRLEQVRVSQILPEGSLAGFRSALADHARWYSSHGYAADRFTMSPVPGSTKGGARVMTVHSHASNVPRDKQDDGWRAFAAKYKANSRIVSTTWSCTEA